MQNINKAFSYDLAPTISNHSTAMESFVTVHMQ